MKKILIMLIFCATSVLYASNYTYQGKALNNYQFEKMYKYFSKVILFSKDDRKIIDIRNSDGKIRTKTYGNKVVSFSLHTIGERRMIPKKCLKISIEEFSDYIKKNTLYIYRELRNPEYSRAKTFLPKYIYRKEKFEISRPHYPKITRW